MAVEKKRLDEQEKKKAELEEEQQKIAQENAAKKFVYLYPTLKINTYIYTCVEACVCCKNYKLLYLKIILTGFMEMDFDIIIYFQSRDSRSIGTTGKSGGSNVLKLTRI